MVLSTIYYCCTTKPIVLTLFIYLLNVFEVTYVNPGLSSTMVFIYNANNHHGVI